MQFVFKKPREKVVFVINKKGYRAFHVPFSPKLPTFGKKVLEKNQPKPPSFLSIAEINI